jgi:hypothetical protein
MKVEVRHHHGLTARHQAPALHPRSYMCWHEVGADNVVGIGLSYQSNQRPGVHRVEGKPLPIATPWAVKVIIKQSEHAWCRIDHLQVGSGINVPGQVACVLERIYMNDVLRRTFPFHGRLNRGSGPDVAGA